jgi:hypothetical protein
MVKLDPPDTMPAAEHAALDVALQAVKAIADLYGICPVCLTYAVADTVEKAVAEGVIHHDGEDDDSVAPTHDAPRARQ